MYIEIYYFLLQMKPRNTHFICINLVLNLLASDSANIFLLFSEIMIVI